MERIPDSVLSPQRKKRTYLNCVLDRAEVHSSYQPSRNGYHVINPNLQLRASSTAAWQPWAQWLNQPLVYVGCGIRSVPGARD